MHQCSYARVWSHEDKRLFQEIGRRIGDALSNLLILRNLRESEKRFRTLFEDSPISLWEEDFSEVKSYIDGLRQRDITDFESYFYSL